MPVRGRPPTPIEIKRLTGRTLDTSAGGRKLPPRPPVAALAPATEVPDPPGTLGVPGLALWERAWATAVTWLSPASDFEAVERAANLADASAAARLRYFATRDNRDARVALAIDRQLGMALSDLGFTPVARSRMGVGEVVPLPKIEALRDRTSS